MKLSIQDGRLLVKLEGVERLLALKGSLEVPLSSITHVEAGGPGQRPQGYWFGVRVPGTFIPGVLKSGTYLGGQGKEFWYYPLRKPYLEVETTGPYRRLVLGINDAADWAVRLRTAAGIR